MLVLLLNSQSGVIGVDLKHIKELMSAMGRSGTKRLLIKKENFELQLERESDESFRYIEPGREFSEESNTSEEKQSRRADMAFSRGGYVSGRPPSPSKLANDYEEGNDEDEKEVSSKASYVKSPMVGTFYAASNPESRPFVQVGDTVKADTIVGIIEAMKVMNEIKAGVTGEVSEVLVENNQPVEFGTSLFKIV